ncbi:MAG: methylmalonyl Co-A mutase-associated GTPase MeaB [Elusimicrobiota bacterium]
MPAAKAQPTDPARLAERVCAGDPAALARALTWVTNESAGHEQVSRALFASHGRSHKVGLCGAPGSGKSSLVSRLVSWYRRSGRTVGVLAVDPTSPFTGGAFLGDRLRIQEHALDEGVFMRSLATRGMMGGLNANIFGAIHVLEAYGFDVVIIETVGTGQDEVDIAEVADTVVCVTAPYQGDEYQAMKAGAMEIADVFAVNKADLEEVDRAVAALRDALSLGEQDENAWSSTVMAVSALTGRGIDELCARIEEHREFLASSPEGRERKRKQLRRELSLLISKRIYRDTLERITDRHLEQLLEKKTDPHTLGRRLIRADKK